MRSWLVAALLVPSSIVLAQPAEPPLQTAPPTASPPTTTREPAPPTQPSGKQLAIGKDGNGFFSPGILTQAWFITERSGDRTNLSTFRLRRAEIYANGEILPKRVAYRVMFDPARVRELADVTVTDTNGDTSTIKASTGPISPLQDAFITFLSDNADVSIGQFKIAVSWEGYNSSGKIIMPERAPISVAFGDKRELGMKVAKSFEKLGYHAAIYNGSGTNTFDTNVQKDVALRLEAYPIDGLTIAGVTYDSIGIRHRKGTKDRWEGDLRYEKGPILFQSEFIEARDVKADKAAAVGGRGFYAAFGYTLDVPALTGKLQPIVRVGYVDPNTDSNPMPTSPKDEDEFFHFDVGANLYLQAHEMKLQMSYQRQQYDDNPANNQLIVAAQVQY